MAEKEKKRPTNRKHLVGLKREQQLNRILVITTAVIVLVVIGLVSWGQIQERFINPRVIVAEVEGQQVTGREFQGLVRYNRQQLIGSYMQQYQYYTLLGSSPQLQQQVLSQMSQIQFQLQPANVGSLTINQIIDNKLIRLEAQKLGIEVSEEEVDAQLETLMGYYPNGRPSSTPIPTQQATSTLSATQLAIVTLVTTPTTIPTLEATTTTEGTGAEPTLAAPTPTITATPTPYTQSAYATQLAEVLTLQDSQLGISAAEFRELIRGDLYRQALFDMITGDEPRFQEQVWARHILVADEASAQDLLDQLQNGADWNVLAAENSLDTGNKDQGGDLGWFYFDQMVEPFAQAAFDLNVGEISEPVQSSFGWHIIQVLGHEDRELTSTEWNQLRATKFQDYVQGLRDKYDWQIYDDKWPSITPDQPDIPAQYQLTQQGP